jgi:hypothetical protein
MSRRTTKSSDVTVQEPLIPLTEDEIAEMQRTLPKLLGDLEDLEKEQGERKKEMAKERKDLRDMIHNIARQLRQQGR